MDVNDNSLIRSLPCSVCDGRMLWTQGAWPVPGSVSGVVVSRAAYACLNGHVLDPAETPQCPDCGVHDTAWDEASGRFVCQRCGHTFTVPR